jgi:uncharacterized protein (DUF302 family)
MVRRFMALLAVTTLLIGLNACDGDDGSIEAQDEVISPFSITATVHDSNVDEVAGRIANYLEEVDDTTKDMPANWVVAGASELRKEHADAEAIDATLKLPGGDRIIEVCNKMYATQAMAFGGHHAVALPCEISVTSTGDGDVSVVILNPEAIFGTFFQDVPAEYADDMAGLAAAVRSELESILVTALDGMNMDTPYEDIGPVWTGEDLASFGAMSNAIHFAVTVPEGSDAAEFQTAFVETLLTTLTHEEMATVGCNLPGLTVADWRAARPYALALPGGSQVVEMCSPTYAAAAMSTGKHHAPALPCQAAIYLNADGSTLIVELLDPAFIFPVFFSDAPAEMMGQMGGLASAVKGDLSAVVQAAIDAM